VQRWTHLVDLKVAGVGCALDLLHLFGEVGVLQAEVNGALHALVALGQLGGRQPLRREMCECGL